jgi:hypothetical protein
MSTRIDSLIINSGIQFIQPHIQSYKIVPTEYAKNVIMQTAIQQRTSFDLYTGCFTTLWHNFRR